MKNVKKKVLIIDKQYFYGGGETFKLDIYRSLGTDKYEFTFSTPREGEFSKVVAGIECDFIPFTPGSRLDFIGMFLYALRMRKNHYDIIITTDSNAWYAGVLLKLIVKPELLMAVVHISTLGIGKNFGKVKSTIIKFVDRLWISFYDFIISSTDFHAKILEKEGISRDKIVIIRNSVDQHHIYAQITEEIKGLWRQKLDIPECAIVCSMFGRFGPGKDYKNLIHAISQVIAKKKDCVFILAGDGPDLEAVKKLAENHNIVQYIRFPGFIRDAYYNVMNLSDIFINSTIAEGISYVVLDAMAMGIPIVATQSGGIGGAVRHEENGILVQAQNPTALADGILNMLCDKEKRERMGDAGKRIQASEFSFDAMAGKLNLLIESNLKQ